MKFSYMNKNNNLRYDIDINKDQKKPLYMKIIKI